jgi:hypothetical protein
MVKTILEGQLPGPPEMAHERLGWSPRPASDAIVASARSLLDIGIAT